MTAALVRGLTASGSGIDATATTQMFTDIKTFITGTVGPNMAGLVLAIIAITIGLRWVKKGARQS